MEDRDYTRLVRLARRFFASAEDAEDAAQDAVLRHFRFYHPARSSSFANLARCLRDVRRSSRASLTAPLTLARDLPSLPTALEPETRVWLSQALPALPEAQARAFLLELDGKTLREIGPLLGVSHETARKYLERAKAALRALL